MKSIEREALKLALEELAVRFSKGWHEGIKIDASDIMLLSDAAEALAQPKQNEFFKWWEENGLYALGADWRQATDYRRYLAEKKNREPHPKEPEQEPVAGEPLPCPFCGHVGLNFEDGSTYRWGIANCGRCGASTGEVRREYPDQGKWHVDAITEWNRRTPPPQRGWVGLTDEEILKEIPVTGHTPITSFARALEAKLKEKNT